MSEPISTPLPEPFADLAGYVDSWARPTFHERYRQRMASPQAALVEFYQALLPRMDAITEHLNQYAPGEVPAADLPLYFLACSFMDVAAAVEIYEQPDVPLGLEWWRPELTECRTALDA